jgi:hypothetical protein
MAGVGAASRAVAHFARAGLDSTLVAGGLRRPACQPADWLIGQVDSRRSVMAERMPGTEVAVLQQQADAHATELACYLSTAVLVLAPHTQTPFA